MQEDYQIYIDPEEDEIFFGRVSEKEKSVSAKLVRHKELNLVSKVECEVNKHLRVDTSKEFNMVEENKKCKLIEPKNELIEKLADGKIEVHRSDDKENSGSQFLILESNNILDKSCEINGVSKSNISVELDHTYSTSVKQKIDKSILATPKSVVKADKDGGFLKVLSEIALVKAEAEADEKEEENLKDEDKENKVINCIPEIKITEPSPEKTKNISPPKPFVNTKVRRFRIIYNSPKTTDNAIIESSNQLNDIKSFTENFESSRNFKNKCLDHDFNLSGVREIDNVEDFINNERRNSKEVFNQTIELIDLNKSCKVNIDAAEDLNYTKDYKEDNTLFFTPNTSMEKKKIVVHTTKEEEKAYPLIEFDDNDTDVKSSKKTEFIEDEEKSERKADTQLVVCENYIVEEKKSLNEFGVSISELNTTTDVCEEVKHEAGNKEYDKESEPIVSEPSESKTSTQLSDSTYETNSSLSLKTVQEDVKSVTSSDSGYRFSKEARKIIENISNAVVDDTLSTSIPEINLDNIDSTFLEQDSINGFYDTPSSSPDIVISNPSIEEEESLKSIENEPVNKRLIKKCSTVEKEQHINSTNNKTKPPRFFSDKRMQYKSKLDINKCVKKLPVVEKPLTEDIRGGRKDLKSLFSSRSPELGEKVSRIPVIARKNYTLTAKTTPAKTPTEKIYKNTKFHNIESPINAYIKNKPTSLIVNVKPEVKKDGVNKVWKLQTGDNVKVNTRTPKNKNQAASVLPFVEYKSATPYKVEKPTESRLPRLAPKVKKLLGTSSPRILKHEGRFYVNTPKTKRISNNESTIVADPKEVSVVVSQFAQKTNTMK